VVLHLVWGVGTSFEGCSQRTLLEGALGSSTHFGGTLRGVHLGTIERTVRETLDASLGVLGL